MRFLRKAARMSSVVSQTLPLELLTAGERGIVVQIDGDPDLVVRLEEMGLHSGVRVCMVRPGSPCILEVNHQRFSFRFDDLVTVLVNVTS
jgi:ferrous iron transport protein A